LLCCDFAQTIDCRCSSKNIGFEDVSALSFLRIIGSAQKTPESPFAKKVRRSFDFIARKNFKQIPVQKALKSKSCFFYLEELNRLA
jgi:hypothetical protein